MTLIQSFANLSTNLSINKEVITMSVEQYWNAFQTLQNLSVLCAADSTLKGQIDTALATAKAGVHSGTAT